MSADQCSSLLRVIHVMRTVHFLIALLPHFFGSRSNLVPSYLRTDTVSTFIRLTKTDLIKCQNCLLSIAGAIRAKHISRKKITDEKGELHQEDFEVTASDFGFVLLQQYCAKETSCGQINVGSRSGSLPQPTTMENHLLPDVADPSASIFCIIRAVSSARCRNCLRESSDSAYLGDFRIAALSLHELHTIYVMSTSQSFQYIVHRCTVSKACIGTTAQIPGRFCAPLILNGPLQGTPYKQTSQLSIESDLGSPQPHLIEIQKQLEWNTPARFCITAKILALSRVIKCMKCLAKNADGVAVLLQHKSDDQHTKTQYMHVLTQHTITTTFWTNCPCGKKDEVVNRPHEVCNERNALQFDTLLINDRMSISMNEEEQKKPKKNVAIKYSSECVWSNFRKKKPCNDCITSLQASSKTNAYLSEETLLSWLRRNFDKRKLASCINLVNSQRPRLCLQFVFVPNFMCEYEFTPFEQATVYQQNRDFSARTDTVSNSSHIGLVSSSAWIHDSVTQLPSSIQLFGATYDLKLNIMRVHFQEDGAYECLRSLALKYDVLMFSLVKKYLWMLHEPEHTFGTDKCQGLDIRKRLRYNVDWMQSKSAAFVDEVFLSRKRKMKLSTTSGGDEDGGPSGSTAPIKRRNLK